MPVLYMYRCVIDVLNATYLIMIVITLILKIYLSVKSDLMYILASNLSYEKRYFLLCVASYKSWINFGPTWTGL